MNYSFGVWFLILISISISIYIWQLHVNDIKSRIETERNRISIRRQFKPPNKYDSTNINYTKDLIDFIRYITAQIALIKFTQYVNNHELDKVTRENLLQLLPDITKHVRVSMVYMHIDFDKLICSEKFIDQYIIDTTMILLDDLISKEVQRQLDEL